jgi:hypothetical protein
MEMQASDLSARLLATENLTVVRGNVPTASFDIKSRVLTLPMWKDMTPEIEDMLIGHEVGHALYTLDKYIEPIRDNPKLHGYMNILEDVRIEKLIKRTYPGLRKRMNEGYKQLNDRDFFGISKLGELDELNLIDRINLYFKAGFQCGVTFTPDEKAFVNRAERTETVDEVIDLAKDIYAYAKEQAEEKKKQRQASANAEGEEDEDPSEADFDDTGDDYESDGEDELDQDKEVGQKKTSGSGATDIEEDNVDPVTDRAFQQNLEELADTGTVYRYHKLDGKLPVDVVVPFKKILKELDFKFDDVYVGDYYRNRVYGGTSPDAEVKYTEKQKLEFSKFKNETSASVNYLIKEFEMKKSAQLYKRAQISKSGSLDMRKVYAYQLQDDLFKRVTTIPQGKNHGMVMLIDWSGSMSDVIMDTIKQVINLAMFCNKAQIPYRVFAFTSQYNNSEESYINKQRANRERMRALTSQDVATGTIYSNDTFNLLELFSNRMSMSEFNGMVRRLLDPRVFWHKGYDLGGTPLNEALMWVYNNIGDYMKANRIEKMNLITLSDGAGGSLQSTLSFSRYNRSYINGQHVKVHDFVRDDVTKKSYKFGYDSGGQTESLIKMIKDRHNIRVVGFYICANRRGTLGSAVNDNLYGYQGNVNTLIDTMRKSFKDQGFYSMSGTGRDDLFIVPADKTKIDDSELVVDSDMSARRLATSLGKFLNTKKTSRVLLSRFIGYIA